jgi:acetyl esterase
MGSSKGCEEWTEIVSSGAALSKSDLSGVAPAFIITADHDPLHDEGDEYAAKLKTANVAVDHTCWPGMVHGLASLAGVLAAGKVLIDQTGAALRKAFRPSLRIR